jgi:hypothetical protein
MIPRSGFVVVSQYKRRRKPSLICATRVSRLTSYLFAVAGRLLTSNAGGQGVYGLSKLEI